MKKSRRSRVTFSRIPGLTKKKMNNQELENRLINFSLDIVTWAGQLNKSQPLIHLKDQLIRSGTAVSLNYGEAQSAESKKDFIHKIGIVMKELRETQINLTILSRFEDLSSKSDISILLAENDELLAIFFKTLQTAKKNLANR
jgi:four helix bundle protein